MRKLAYKLVEEVVNFKPKRTVRIVLKDPDGGFLAESPSKIFQNKKIFASLTTKDSQRIHFLVAFELIG
jgi:hypothetical protein